MATAMINGVPHAYTDTGHGDPVLLLHAGVADRRMWDAALPHLSTNHRVITVDLRGYGDTSLPDGRFVYADDVAQLLATLGIAQTHVVAISMSCSVALDLAVARPELLDHLVLVAPTVDEWDWDASMEEFDATETELFEAGKLDEASWLNVRFWVDGPHRGTDEVDTHVREQVFTMQRRAFELDNDAAEDGWLAPDRYARLAQVVAPTLIVYGELDQPDFPRIAHYLSTQLPAAKLEPMAGVAHLPPMESPEAFAQLVRGFLATDRP